MFNRNPCAFVWAGALSAICCAITPTIARALTFEFRPDANGKEHLVMSGRIITGDTDRFKRFIAANPDQFIRNNVVLDSPGGDVKEAIEMAKIFRKLLISVQVFSPAKCASACFLLYVGAPWRIATGAPVPTLAIHRPIYVASGTSRMSPEQADQANSAGYSLMTKWLQEQLVPQYLIDLLLSRPSSDIYWLTNEDIDRIGTRAPWYEEWILARCPDILKAEKFMFETNSSEEARRRHRAASYCENSNVMPYQAAEVKRLMKR